MKWAWLAYFSIFLFILAGCGDDSNDNGTGGNTNPTISAMTPNQVSRGQLNVEGQITGTNLTGASVNLGDGITVQSVNASGSTQISVVFSVAPGASAGARTVTVTTPRGSASAAGALNVLSNRAPTPKISISPTSGAKNTTFVFDASTSTDSNLVSSIQTYHWEFGDGASANGRVQQHKYNAAGDYDVVLTVTDNTGASNEAATSLEVVDGIAPVARFNVTPEAGDQGTNFTFNGSGSSDSDGNIDIFRWNFDDGSSAQGEIVNHTYTKSGVFEVTLTVTDNDGIDSVAEKNVRVEAFNEEKAKADITNLIEKFFRRFANLEQYSAEVIVEGWSLDPACNGREREIRIIEEQQAALKSTDNELTKPVVVLVKPSHVDANANATAFFQYTFKNGTKGQGTALHEFSLIFEDGEWQICNFKVTEMSGSVGELFPAP
jgi:PKD repeat protein